MGEIKVVKPNNPLSLGLIAPRIKDFHDRINCLGITYESLYQYFCNTIQFGRGMAEFWVALDGNEPLAFAHFLVRGLPHIGKVYCDYIYSWTKRTDAAWALFEQFEKFGERHNAPYYEGDPINKTILRLFRMAANKFGYDIHESGHINCVARKRIIKDGTES